MLSPVQGIVAGVLVALGGLFFVAQPFHQHEAKPPGAEMVDPTGVTARVTQDCVDVFATPIVCRWVSADARLSGTMTHEWTVTIGEDPGIGWAPATLEGPEGDWRGHLYSLWTAPAQLFVFLSGDGAYEGWHYVGASIDSVYVPGDSEWNGVVYEGDPPPFGPPPPTAD